MTSRERATLVYGQLFGFDRANRQAIIDGFIRHFDAHAAEAVAVEREATVQRLCPQHGLEHRLENGVWWGFCGARVLLELYEDRERRTV